MSIGAMREHVTIQTDRPLAIRLTALTWAGGLASATTAAAHGYTTGDYVTIAGATPSGFNGKVKVTVTGASAFTYPVTGPLTTPATGSITVVYTSNAHGGLVVGWRTVVAGLPAERIPLRAFERLQLAAIQSDTTYRFRIRVRSDLAPTMRLLWTPSWPREVAQKTLAITGINDDPDDITRQFLEAAEVAAA